MDQTTTNVAFIFLGAFLTLTASASIEIFKDYLTVRRKRKNYQIYSRLQLSSVLKVLSRLKYSYENKGLYEPRDVSLLEKALEPLNNIRNDTTILKPVDTQEKLIDLISDANLYITDIKSMTAEANYPRPDSPHIRLDGSPGDEALSGRESWLEKNIELIDLRRRVEDLIKVLS